jgi:DNA segregation ATPase FtsK/SpoIIIE, S-DNA-T family
MDNKALNQIISLLTQIDSRLEKIEQSINRQLPPTLDFFRDPDPLLPKAVEVILQYNKASASLTQRYLKIGYARASMILDQLAKQGIISQPDGAKPRKIYADKANEFLSNHTS